MKGWSASGEYDRKPEKIVDFNYENNKKNIPE